MVAVPAAVAVVVVVSVLVAVVDDGSSGAASSLLLLFLNAGGRYRSTEFDLLTKRWATRWERGQQTISNNSWHTHTHDRYIGCKVK